MPIAGKNAGIQVDGKPETTTALARREERRGHRPVPFERFADPQDVVMRLCRRVGPLLPRPPPAAAPQSPGAHAVAPQCRGLRDGRCLGRQDGDARADQRGQSRKEDRQPWRRYYAPTRTSSAMCWPN
jgi:hypothetical protein